MERKMRPRNTRDGSPSTDEPSAIEDTESKQQQQQQQQLKLRPTSIAVRLSLLHSAQELWKEKVEEKDISQFTVEGKMSRLGISVDRSNQQLPKKSGRPAIVRALSSPNLNVFPDDEGFRDQSDEERSSGGGGGGEGDAASVRRIEVPVVDHRSLSLFFSSSSSSSSSDNRLNPSTADLDFISKKATVLRILSRTVRANRTRPGSSNPLRSTQRQYGLLQTHYTETKTGVAQQELKRIKQEQILGTTHFAQEALAGLASKENFSNVTLRKTDQATGGGGGGDRHLPFSDVMLMQIKGRRFCQTRLVEPKAHLVNSGDCYILVTPETVYLWIGEYCNVIEKAKATDVANQIVQKRDFGIRPTCRLVTIPEEYQDVFPEAKQFWKTLEATDPSNSKAQPPGASNEDDVYELCITETNGVYRLMKGDQRLVKVDELSEKALKYEILRSKEAFVFDFGGEMYVWTGKHVPFDRRRKILQLAVDLWNAGYDYSRYDLNPLAPLYAVTGGEIVAAAGSQRPRWALFGKINQNMETVLFREKFIDWPDSSRLIKVKGQSSAANDQKPPEAAVVLDLQPYDAKRMIPVDMTPVSLVLEGSHLGRGSHWEGFEKGIRRAVDIITQGIDIWHVMEFDHYLLDEASHGQLHDGDTYVIRWHYVIAQTGSKTVRSDSVLGGRVRCAYFFWQGRNSSISEKGASALMTVELDEERGPQIRVIEGKEPPCFLNLFRGRMIVHIGKREDESTSTKGDWKLFIVRNELPAESYLLEVPVGASQLRSRGSFLLLNLNTAILFLWHGVKTTNNTVLRARELALLLRQQCPVEVGMKTEDVMMPLEMMEGNERPEFWDVLQNNDTDLIIYDTLVQDPRPYSFTPRLFHLTSISGEFEATEVVNPARGMDVSPFPFLQSDMYSASQPAIFLLDNYHEVYLWQGWWPSDTEEETGGNVRTASSEARFLLNRRCAMHTALQYCKEVARPSVPPSYLVFAGVEPVVFTNIFPIWESSEVIMDAMLKEGKTSDDLELVEDALGKLTNTELSWEDLQRRPLPDGVNPLKLETYLSQEEFEEVIGMSRDEFDALPGWKQVNIKKETGLF